MGAKETVRQALLLVALIAMFPVIVAALFFVLGIPNSNPTTGVEIMKNAIVPWWLVLVENSPLLLVLLVLLAGWAGAEDAI